MRSVSLASAVSAAAAVAAVGSLCNCGSTGAVAGVPRASTAPLALGGPDTRVESRLDDGVRVIVEESHASPVVAIQVWVAAGAADDPPGLAGSAHLLERLVLRGTAGRPPGAARREVEAAGGAIGAWTGLDETVYHLVLPAPLLALGLDVLSDALSRPLLSPSEVERERKLVLGEVARSASDPRSAATAALRAALFPDEPEGRPLLGTGADVAARTRDELAARFAETYVGANLTVVVVGDVEARAARAAVGRAFGSLPPGKASPRPTSPAFRSPPASARVGLVGEPAAAAEVMIGFREPALDAEEAAALDLLGAVLARGEGARFDRQLVHGRQIAADAHAFTYRGRQSAMLGLELEALPRRIEAVARAAIDEALRLGREEIPADELDRARRAVESDSAAGEAGLEGHARRLGYGGAVVGDPDDGARYRAALAALGPAELRKAAAELLRPGSLAVAAVGAEATEAGRRRHLADLIAGAVGRAAPAAPGPSPAREGPDGDLVRVVHPSGVRIVALRDPGAPVVTVEALWAGQPAAALADGVTPLFAALLDRGTRTRSALEIAAELQADGGSMAGFADRGQLGLRAELLPGAWRRGLALVSDCLLHPSFPAEAVDAERRVLLESARAASEDPADRAWRLFGRQLWPRAAPSFDPPGAELEIAAAGRVRLLDLYHRRYPVSDLVVAVVGDVDPAEVVGALGAAFGEAIAAPKVPGAETGGPPSEPERHEPSAAFGIGGKDAAEVVIGYPGPGPRDPDRLPVEVLAGVLAADGGPLKRALLDDPPLAYRVDVKVAAGGGPGFLAVSWSCLPGRLDRSVAAVRAVLGKVASEVTATEVGMVTRRLTGSAAVGLAGRAAIAEALALDEARGLPLMSYRQVPVALGRVTRDDVARAARRLLDPQHEVIAVVRPPEEPPARGRGLKASR